MGEKILIANLHRNICEKYKTNYVPLNLHLKLGVSDNFFSGEFPLNGLRHLPQSDTCGWYLWAGDELSNDPGFFKPMHLFHLVERKSPILEYLGLPPGWRFLVAEGYEDVWFDEKLLAV